MDSENRTRQVLDLLHRQLTLPPGSSRPEELLKELARAFAATGAGLACVRAGQTIVQHRVPVGSAGETQRLLQQLQTIESAGVVEGNLAARGPTGRLLWLEAEAGQSWSRSDQAALALTANALDVLVPGDVAPPPEQVRFHQRLQDAAVLSGKLAHAFDNILTGILGFAELTLSQSPHGSDAAKYLTEVLGAAQQGVQLTQQFHQFSRSATVAEGSASVPLVLTELEHVLRSSLKPAVNLVTNVPADLPLTAIASETLQLTLQHLLANAQEAVGAAGTITLSARRAELSREQAGSVFGHLQPGPCVEISIGDSGPGIAAEARPHLLVEPFFSNKPRHRGLGLALVYRTLYAHQAGFTLEPGPTGGTVARVYLPLAPATAMSGRRNGP